MGGGELFTGLNEILYGNSMLTISSFKWFNYKLHFHAEVILTDSRQFELWSSVWEPCTVRYLSFYILFPAGLNLTPALEDQVKLISILTTNKQRKHSNPWQGELVSQSSYGGWLFTPSGLFYFVSYWFKFHTWVGKPSCPLYIRHWKPGIISVRQVHLRLALDESNKLSKLSKWSPVIYDFLIWPDLVVYSDCLFDCLYSKILYPVDLSSTI